MSFMVQVIKSVSHCAVISLGKLTLLKCLVSNLRSVIKTRNQLSHALLLKFAHLTAHYPLARTIFSTGPWILANLVPLPRHTIHRENIFYSMR